MPLIMGPTVEVSMVRPGQTAAQRAIARIAGPMREGQTLVKRDGAWAAVRGLNQDQLAAAEQVLMGGHVHDVSDETYDEIVADGITPLVLVPAGIVDKEDGGVVITESDDDQGRRQGYDITQEGGR